MVSVSLRHSEGRGFKSLSAHSKIFNKTQKYIIMPNKTEIFNKQNLKQDLLDVRVGDTIKVYQKIKETTKKDKGAKEKKTKEKIQVFEGLVLARKHGKGISSTITVRKVISKIGVEKIFPIHSPLIEKIEIVKRAKVRRAKLYYLRAAKGRKARLKRKEYTAPIKKEIKPEPEIEPEQEKSKPENIEKQKIKEKTKNVEPENTETESTEKSAEPENIKNPE